MSNNAKDKKYEGLADEIVDLLATVGEHLNNPEQESEVKKAYIKPFMLGINQEQYKKFKSIMLFVHTISDSDNDTISYNCSSDGFDLSVEWKTPTVLVSKSDQSMQMLIKILSIADSFSIDITGLDEITVSITVKDVMKKIDKEI